MAAPDELKIKPAKEKPTPTIGKILGLKAPMPWNTSKVVPLDAPCPSLLYGIELEIEQISNDRDPYVPHGMRSTEDGSLRSTPGHFSREFITEPMTYSHIAYTLKDFFARNAFTANNYSERCSIHVHTNVHNLTFEQLATLLLTYQVYERVLFNWIGHERDRNIFCVPWYDTTMTHRIVDRIKQADQYTFSEWQKYTALNLIPVHAQASIEWRHMHGHCDIDMLLQWLRLIGHIYQFALDVSFEDAKTNFANLNTTSQYLTALNQVFLHDADILRAPGYENHMEDGVLAMKYSLLTKTPTAENKVKAATTYNWDNSYFSTMNEQELLQELHQNRRVIIQAVQAAAPQWMPVNPVRDDRVGFTVSQMPEAIVYEEEDVDTFERTV